ncbi:hypothetical protein AB0L00_16155 [Actinoallomurus sp. NPDC052308]|uniref:hypothetical protein n=1 Tax=Actinoallomurus sp. NPDC052308 TaxID=3155530 RepID=UPI00342B4F78
MIVRSRPIHWVTVALLALALAMFVPPGGPAGARTGTYRLAILQVSYADSADHDYSTAQLQAAGGELSTYFGQLSNGQLNLQVSVYSAPLTESWQTRAHYWTGVGDDLLQHAVSAAAGSGLQLSGLDGVIVLSPGTGGDFTIDPRQVHAGGVTQTVQNSYDFEQCGGGCGPAGGHTPGLSRVWWNGWAHEIGHQLELADGTVLGGNWNGHPGQYSSGYDLMDSGYPDSESVYGLSRPEIGTKAVFPGWLPASKVSSDPAPSSGAPVSTNFDLAPISQASSSTSNLQGLKLPIAPGVYLTVEARRRVGADSYSVGPGIFDEGILLHSVSEMSDPPVRPIDSCDYVGSGGCVRERSDSRAMSCQGGGTTVAASHPYCWPYALFHVGDTYTDAADNITVQVTGQNPTTGTYHVVVTRGVMTGHPQLYVTPWQTAPMHTWETRDIWVDSSCNGYGVYKYGAYPAPDGNVGQGNGDDPCVGHPNRVYVRVHNVGTTPAEHVVVNFKASNPLGTGVGPDTGWSDIGSASEAGFPALTAIPAGGYADVYVEWTPNVDPSRIPDATSFSFHSCLQVQVSRAPGETSDAGHLAQENFDYFQAQTGMDGGSGFAPHDVNVIQRSIHLVNEYSKADQNPRLFYINTSGTLPDGAEWKVGDGQSRILLQNGEARDLPVTVTLPADIPAGRQYRLNVTAGTVFTTTNPAIPDRGVAPQTQTEYRDVGGVVIDVDTVQQSAISLTGTQYQNAELVADGKLIPGLAGQIVTVDYLSPDGAQFSHQVQVQSDGTFSDKFSPPKPQVGKWRLRAIWQGTQSISSAVTTVDAVVSPTG